MPFFLERKGDVYLTEGYKGAPYGLMVKVPVEAGPFRGEFALDPIVIRQALRVDPDTAQVTAVSDPLPQIHHGIPLRVRQVLVTIDRPGFMRNPTDCNPKQIDGAYTSVDGAATSASSSYQATDCSRLPLRPRLAMRLTGRGQVTIGKHPKLRAVLTQRPGEANIKRAEVRLPLSLALDPRNTSNPSMLCSYEGGIAGNCPRSSIVGQATAVSPLLKRALSGPVHLVQGIKFGANGVRVRTLPTLLLALRGEVDLNVRARSDVKRNRLVSTFPAIPDAAVSRFELNLKGGRKGILAVTRGGLCGRRQFAASYMDGHNGKQHDRRVAVRTGACKAHKRAASRRKAAKKRRALRSTGSRR